MSTRSRPVSASAPHHSRGRGNRERLLAGIPEDWRAALRDAIDDEAFGRLADYLAEERSRPDTEIYPPESQVFRALQLTTVTPVRAVGRGLDALADEIRAVDYRGLR